MKKAASQNIVTVPRERESDLQRKQTLKKIYQEQISLQLKQKETIRICGENLTTKAKVTIGGARVFSGSSHGGGYRRGGLLHARSSRASCTRRAASKSNQVLVSEGVVKGEGSVITGRIEGKGLRSDRAALDSKANEPQPQSAVYASTPCDSYAKEDRTQSLAALPVSQLAQAVDEEGSTIQISSLPSTDSQPVEVP